MLLMPGAEGLLIRAISCKVISCSTHKAVAFLPLVVVHCLSHSKAQPPDDIWLRASESGDSGSGGSNSSSSSIATHPTGAGYLLTYPYKCQKILTCFFADVKAAVPPSSWPACTACQSWHQPAPSQATLPLQTPGHPTD